MSARCIPALGVALALSAIAAPEPGWGGQPDFQALAARHEAEAVSLRRSLHEHPELSLREHETQATLRRLFSGMPGVELVEGEWGTGVVAVLRGGKPGPVVAWRTDMDALPITEKTGLPYASSRRDTLRNGREVGVMHACGHDMHMAVAVGMMRILSEVRDRLPGTVLFIGEPAEEVGAGAHRLLENGLFADGRRPKCALAIHVHPTIPFGRVGSCPGHSTANVDGFVLRVLGEGGHGAYPHETIDPVTLAARMVLAFQSLIGREVDVNRHCVISVGSIHGGTKSSAIPDDVVIEATVRSHDEATRLELRRGIERTVRGLAEAAGAPEPELEYYFGTPAGYNHPRLVEECRTVFRRVLGGENEIIYDPPMGGEDFSYYGREVPAFQFRLGVGRPDREMSLHAADFDPDERAIGLGMRLAAELIWDQLRRGERWDQSASAADQAGPGAHHSRRRDDGLPPKAPNPWFYLERAYPLGRIPREEWQRAQIQAEILREEASLERGAWDFGGPANIGGRITDMAVDPTDENIVYAGAAEGGVLGSLDGGETWTPLFDDMPTLSIGALAIDPIDPHVIYAGTGEVNPGGGSVAYGGAGLFRSPDGGETWESLGLENTGSIGRIRIDPTDSERIFVAAMGNLWTESAERGVYRTTDGGTTWEQVLFLSDSTGCVDLIMRPDHPDILLAAMWERIRRPEYYRYGGVTCGVYRTTDGGDSWNLVTGGLPAPSANGGRIGLSLCESRPEVMHAVYADRIGYFDGLYRSIDGGYTWMRTNDGALGSIFASYGWWFGNVRTHPLDQDMIYVLGLDFWRSANGGASYHDATGGMHVDHHGLDFGPGPDPVLFEGNDGGVYRSTNGGTAWTKLPDQPITQVYRLALDANNPDALYGGTQDNGTCRTLSGATNDWTMIFGGDGFQPLVHPTNSNRIWVQYQYGNLYYSGNGGYSWNLALSGVGGGDRRNWNSPLAQDPTDPDRRYFGTNRVYRSVTNTSWTAVSPDLTGGPHLDNPGQVDGTLTTLAVSPLDGNVIWAGSNDGLVHVTTDSGGEWTDVSAGLPDRWITSVRTDPLSRETAYVTVSGFRWGEPLPHVFRTTDLGSSWEPIAGNLPEAPANDFIADPASPQHYFVATDVGVYRTLDGGGTWSMLGSNLPRVVVTSLAFDEVNRVLFAGTYGRSFFSYQVEDLAGIEELPARVPSAVGRLLPPHPNPTRGGAWIGWETPRSTPVRVEVLTVAGRRVWSRSLPERAAGAGEVRWDGRDSRGRDLPPGTYFVRVHAGRALLGSGTIVLIR